MTTVAVQADDYIVLGGLFSTVASTTQNYLARVAPNGTLDTTFQPPVDGPVRAMAIQDDGRIVGGSFTTVDGTSQGNVARLS